MKAAWDHKNVLGYTEGRGVVGRGGEKEIEKEKKRNTTVETPFTPTIEQHRFICKSTFLFTEVQAFFLEKKRKKKVADA